MTVIQQPQQIQTQFLNHKILRPSKSERECSPSLVSTSSSSSSQNPLVVSDDNRNRFLLIINGAKMETRKGQGDLEKIRKLACEFEIDLVEKVSASMGDSVRIARENGADLNVLVLGGDGSFRECVQGYREWREMMNLREDAPHSIAIVALPCGTGNNFAKDLGIDSIEKCFEKIRKGDLRACDAVKVMSTASDGKEIVTYSINVVTWGMARDAAESAEKMRFLGPIRYDLAGFYHIMKNKSNVASLTIETNGVETGKCVDEDFLMLFCQNTKCSGRGFAFTPLAKINDGLMDVVVAKKVGLIKTVKLFDDTKTGGGHVEKDGVFYVQCENITIETGNREELIGIDGEVTITTPAKLKCIPNSFVTFV